MGYLILLIFILEDDLICNVCNVSNPMQCNLLYINRLQIGTTASGGQNASARWVRRPGVPDHDANCVLPSMQTDQDGPLASAGCVGPLEMP
jgi:hypothetical protein